MLTNAQIQQIWILGLEKFHFINDAIQIQLLQNPDVEAMTKQMYANRLMEIQTELNEKVNQ